MAGDQQRGPRRRLRTSLACKSPVPRTRRESNKVRSGAAAWSSKMPRGDAARAADGDEGTRAAAESPWPDPRPGRAGPQGRPQPRNNALDATRPERATDPGQNAAQGGSGRFSRPPTAPRRARGPRASPACTRGSAATLPRARTSGRSAATEPPVCSSTQAATPRSRPTCRYRWPPPGSRSELVAEDNRFGLEFKADAL